MLAYLDSSAIVKRYVAEHGSDVVQELYDRAYSGDIRLSFSTWNIGEVLVVLDKYRRRDWLDEASYRKARQQFLSDTLRLLKLSLLKIMPVKARVLVQCWRLIERYHIYEADALQILSSKNIGADRLYTGDKLIHEIALKEGVNCQYLGPK